MQNKTKIVALTSIYAAIYVVLVFVFEPFSFGPLQLRIADVLVATVPLFGYAGVLGHTLGVFISNMYSPYGPIDLLNTIPSFIMAFVVYYIYKKTNNDKTVIGTCIAYSAVIGVTVGWMLSYFGAPLIGIIIYITIGNVIASVIGGWPLFKLLKKLGVHRLINSDVHKESK